jgi:predicted transcriptional regulator
MAIYSRSTPEGVLRDQVRALAAQGMTIQDIAKELGVGTFWVQRIVQDSNINSAISYYLRNIWEATSQMLIAVNNMDKRITAIEKAVKVLLASKGEQQPL